MPEKRGNSDKIAALHKKTTSISLFLTKKIVFLRTI